jgi:hypothetical protein
MKKKFNADEMAIALHHAVAAGKTREQLAQELGCSLTAIHLHIKRTGIELPHALRKYNDPRADEMAAMYKIGCTLEKIGQQYGLTRERVRQLIKKYHGIVGKDGGAAAQGRANKQTRLRNDDMRCFKRWGCSREQYRHLQKLTAASQTRERSPIGAFCTQRCNAMRRGIGWELKLWEWWGIWQASGYWEQRGRGQGYVMARLNDEGPYAAGNVYICSAAENSSKQKRKKSGLPTGVRFFQKGNYKTYFASRMAGGKKYYLGSFKSPELAHAAYLAAAPQLQPLPDGATRAP